MAGLVPAIHALFRGAKNVHARAFASPKRLRPRRRDELGHDDLWHISKCDSPARKRERERAFFAATLVP
jgi:hypothetical protein